MGQVGPGPGGTRIEPGRVSQVASPGSPKRPEAKPEELPLMFSNHIILFILSDFINKSAANPKTCVIPKLLLPRNWSDRLKYHEKRGSLFKIP